MKNVIKVQSLENLPNTRPIIAMDNAGNLFGQNQISMEFVDLGLSVKWAKCNLGAKTETDYGDYYAWGETESKSDYSWTTYIHSKGTNSTLTKYCNNSSKGYNGYTDNLTTLESIDDAANKILGGNWRMPTEAELNELRDTTKVTSTWVTKNGVNGREFTSLINGNTLFLPASGWYNGSTLEGVGSGSCYWTSSLYESNPVNSMRLGNHQNGTNMEYYSRCRGFGVRPVF